MRKMYLCVLLVVGSCIPMPGCSQMDKSIDMTQAVAMKIVDRAKVDQSTIGAQTEAINPEVSYSVFGGTGFYSRGTIAITGLKFGADVTASGLGEAVNDPELREMINAIMNRTDIDEKIKTQMVLDLIRDALLKLKEDKSPEP